MAKQEAAATSKKRKSKEDKPVKRERISSEAHKRKNLKRTSTSTSKKAPEQQAKRQRRHADTVEEAKRLWNELRKKTNTPEQNRKLMDQMMPLVTGKACEIALQHDASRVVQAALQFGRPEERKSILVELCQKQDSSSNSYFVELCKSQYAHFVVLKAIKYCHSDKECVDMIIKILRGHMPKLCVHGIASRVVEALFQALSSKQTAVLKQEFYGPLFSLFAADTLRKQEASVPTLSSNLAAAPEKKDMTVDFVRNLVNKGLEKHLYGYSYFQDLLDEFLLAAPSNEVRGIASTAADHCIHLVSTRAGTRAVASLIAYGTAKDRKRIMKSLKGYSRSGLLHHDAYLAIVRLVQLTDDTVSIQKNVFHELLATETEDKTKSPLLELALSDCASKLFLMLLEEKEEARNKFFDPYERSVLLPNPTVIEDGEAVPTSKKDSELRRKELLKHLREPLIELCCQHTEELLRSPAGGRVCREVYSAFRPEKLVQALVDVCISALQKAEKDHASDAAPLLFEDRNGHLALKSLISVDAADVENRQDCSLAFELCKRLTSERKGGIMDVASSNRGAFVVEAMCKIPTVRDSVVVELNANRKAIEKLSKGQGATAGYLALLKELSSKNK